MCIAGSIKTPGAPPTPAAAAPKPLESVKGIESAPTLKSKLLTAGGGSSSLLSKLKIPLNTQ